MKDLLGKMGKMLGKVLDKAAKFSRTSCALFFTGAGIWVIVWGSNGIITKIFGGIIVSSGLTLLLWDLVWKKSLRLKQIATGLGITVIVGSIIASLATGWPKSIAGLALTVFLIVLIVAIYWSRNPCQNERS